MALILVIVNKMISKSIPRIFLKYDHAFKIAQQEISKAWSEYKINKIKFTSERFFETYLTILLK